MNIKIEKGIAVPKRFRPGYGKILKLMKVGESFMIEPGCRSGIYTAARLNNVKVLIRKVTPHRVRVWRTA